MQSIISWHKPKITLYSNTNNEKYYEVSMDFDRFFKCGFYDWKLFFMSPAGKLYSLYKIVPMDQLEKTPTQNQAGFKSQPVQGRFIVHPKNANAI